jgi:hypothetical protein
MQFSYTYLKQAEQNDIQLGKWNGHVVYAISKAAIERGDYYFEDAYVIYDDDNLLFCDGKVYGTVKPNGTVIECNPRKYIKEVRRESTPSFSNAVVAEQQQDYKSEVIGDVNLELEVDKMLKSGRGTSVEELLKGFDYGL